MHREKSLFAVVKTDIGVYKFRMLLVVLAAAFAQVAAIPNASQFGKMAMPIWLPPSFGGQNEIFGEYAWFRREFAVGPEMEQAVC